MSIRLSTTSLCVVKREASNESHDDNDSLSLVENVIDIKKTQSIFQYQPHIISTISIIPRG